MPPTAPMCTRLRAHIEAGLELLEEAMRDGVIDAREQISLRSHIAETLALSEEHEATTKLALALQHGGFTRRTYYAGREVDTLYGNGELTPHLKVG